MKVAVTYILKRAKVAQLAHARISIRTVAQGRNCGHASLFHGSSDVIAVLKQLAGVG